MEAIDAYKIYVALKNHFTLDTYDYFKYNKKTNVSYDSFLKRKDKIFFAKLGNRKKDYLENFLVANFIYQTNMWIGELLSDECEDRYREWKKRQESLTYHFSNQINFVGEMNKHEFNELFHSIDGNHPKIIRMYFRREISLETLVILDSILKFMIKSDKSINDPIYREVSKLCKKYQPFLRFDEMKMKSALKQVLLK
jgi:hypothetical protein